ncbi:helix-turn-helix domain-containing protein [Nonomuraea sp. NPDC004580]|uniref:helix-turn-helix domain-containing protein n=1 Tax=Nonomuraea sp. NPDC004580 TaxID=3154552 RepID=UPI0033B1A91D
MSLHIDAWNIEARPWGWLRLREISGEGPTVYLHFTYAGPAGKERLDLQEVVMQSGAGEPLSARTWRRIPLSQIEQLLTQTLSLANSAPTQSTAEAGKQALASFRSSDVDPPTLDDLDRYFAATEDATVMYFQPVASGMLVSDGGELPPGRVPHLKPPEGRLTDEFLSDVAETYRWVTSTKYPPAPAIAEMTKVPVRTVHRWIYEARKRGILPPARPGRAG